MAAQSADRECRWNRRGAGVQHRLVVGVVEFQDVAEIAVAQRGGGRRHPWAAKHMGIGPTAHVHQHLEPGRHAARGTAGDRRADVVEQFALDHRARGCRHLVPAQLLRLPDERFEHRLAAACA